MNTKEFQEVLKWGRVTLVVLAVFLAVEALGALKGLSDTEPVYNTISVTGEGEVVAIPDVATLSFAATAESKTVSDAQTQVTERMEAILSGLKGLGVEDKDIKTTDYSIQPKYVYSSSICSSTYCPPSRQIQDGYTVRHVVSVKIRNTENVGQTITLLGEKKASNVSNVSFEIDDADDLLGEARDLAIADAKIKARLLAKELGVRLIRVIGFYENTEGEPIPYYNEAFGGDSLKSLPAVAPSVPLGENIVRIKATILYEIR